MSIVHIVSYNVNFGRKSNKCIPWLIQQKQADIVCLQEFPEDKISDYIASLPSEKYAYIFAPSMRIFKKIYGELTVFRTKRCILKNQKIISLGTNNIERTLFRNGVHRSALLATFLVHGKRFTVINVHLTSYATNKSRYQQIDKILDAVKNIWGGLCIIGDYNMPSITTNNNFIRYMHAQGFSTSEAYASTFRLAFIKFRLDYAFVRRAVIENMRVDRIHFSDHFPIHGTIKI